MSEKAAVAAEKVEGLCSSLPTPEDARGLVTAARRKVKAATVAVDASPNPYVATAAAYVGVKPSSLIGGGLTLAAVALSAYAGVGGRTRDDAGYAAFDREAGRTDRGRDGGAGRERQRAVLEKQLAADRDAQRARWRSAMDDGSAAAASSETAAEDERRRLERIRRMNRASGDATAAAEAKLREARDRNENAAKNAKNASSSAAAPGATATMSAADRRRAEQKARAEAAVLSEYQTAEDEPGAGWDAEEVKEMSKKYKAFLKASKAKKWWGGGD